MVAQAALAAHRARKVKARLAVKNHVHASLDLVFPGLSGCFSDLLDTRLGRLLLTEGLDPERVRRLGPERLRAFCARRGVRVDRTKAVRLVEAARDALTLPPQVGTVNAEVLAADVALLSALDRAIGRAEEEIAEVLPRTPAGVLTTMPRVGSSGLPPTGRPLGTRRGSAPPRRSTAWRGSSPGSTSPRGGDAPTRPSPGRGRRSSARRSSSWGGPRQGDQSAEHRCTIMALRSTARRALVLQAEADDLETEIERLVAQVAPGLLDEPGVGAISAAQILCSWSHGGRLRSDAAFAALAGAAPVPASSGQTVRHRLNRGLTAN
jgi:transposase